MGSSASQRQIFLWALVLSAAGIEHRVVFAQPEWQLWVATEEESAASREIAAYEAENQNWPPKKITDEATLFLVHRPVIIPVLGALLGMYVVTGPWQDNGAWFLKGSASTSDILVHHQWWRVVTALTLHADSVHLLGNLLIGGVLAHFLCRLLGSGFGWLLTLLAGALGNSINAILRGGGAESVGFSTAVFGMVGILAGLRLARLTALQDVLIGIGGALSLLAFLGTEGARTDLGAHLWGVVCGLGLGFLAARLNLLRWVVMARAQVLAGLFSLGFVVGAWLLAFSW